MGNCLLCIELGGRDGDREKKDGISRSSCSGREKDRIEREDFWFLFYNLVVSSTIDSQWDVHGRNDHRPPTAVPDHSCSHRQDFRNSIYSSTSGSDTYGLPPEVPFVHTNFSQTIDNRFPHIIYLRCINLLFYSDEPLRYIQVILLLTLNEAPEMPWLAERMAYYFTPEKFARCLILSHSSSTSI